MAKLCRFFREFLVSVSVPEEVVDLSSDPPQPDEVAKWNLVEELVKFTLVGKEVDLVLDTVHSVPQEVVPSF